MKPCELNSSVQSTTKHQSGSRSGRSSQGSKGNRTRSTFYVGKPPASGVEILDISAKLVPILKLFAASARKQVICNLYACLDKVQPIYQTIRLNDHRIKFEIDSGASDTFCCEATWQTLGKPTLQPVTIRYQVAEGSPLPVVGQFQSTASIDGKSPDVTFPVIVTKVPNLNLLGRLAMMKLKLTNLTDHFRENLSSAESTATIEHVTTTGPENSLHAACIQLCGEFPTLFESDFSLDIRFKPEAKPIFKKPRPVPFSIFTKQEF